MNKATKAAIAVPFIEDRKCHCGLCGVLVTDYMVMQLTPQPANLNDFIPICKDCNADFKETRWVNGFPSKLEAFRHIVSVYPTSNFLSKKKYQCAVRFGMPPAEKLKVVFYFETLKEKR